MFWGLVSKLFQSTILSLQDIDSAGEKMQRTKILALTITIALVAVVIVTGTALAQAQGQNPTSTPDPTPAPTITTDVSDQTNCPAISNDINHTSCLKGNTVIDHTNCPNSGTNEANVNVNCQQNDHTQANCDENGNHGGMRNGVSHDSMMNGYGHGNMMGRYR